MPKDHKGCARSRATLGVIVVGSEFKVSVGMFVSAMRAVANSNSNLSVLVVDSEFL